MACAWNGLSWRDRDAQHALSSSDMTMSSLNPSSLPTSPYQIDLFRIAKSVHLGSWYFLAPWWNATSYSDSPIGADLKKYNSARELGSWPRTAGGVSHRIWSQAFGISDAKGEILLNTPHSFRKKVFTGPFHIYSTFQATHRIDLSQILHLSICHFPQLIILTSHVLSHDRLWSDHWNMRLLIDMWEQMQNKWL
jgi:hypothetical protein